MARRRTVRQQRKDCLTAPVGPCTIKREVVKGARSRYAIETFRTRFGGLHYFVLDAEGQDEVTGGPAVVGQSDSHAEAMARARRLVDAVESRED